MSQPQPNSSDFDEHMLSFADLPYRYRCLAEGHVLQAAVPAWAAQCLQIYASAAARTAAATALQLPARAMKQRLPRPKQPCRHTATARRRKTPKTHLSTPPPPTTFACPFYKRNPQRHRACAWTVALRSVRSAKQHVIVHHHAPIRCPVCAAHFPSAAARDTHVRARGCAKREPAAEALEGATQSQVDRLLRRDVVPRRGGDRRRRCGRDGGDGEGEESWFCMWDVLFPAVERPETGYLDTREEREVVALRRFWRRAGPRVVRGLLGSGEGADLATREAVAGSVLREMTEQAGLVGGC